jgi:hypothetical protein
VLPLAFVKEEHQKFGFNHTDESKFGQLEACLWELSYYPRNHLKEKVSCIAPVPSLPLMDKHFSQLLLHLLQSELGPTAAQLQQGQILESSLRRLVYSNTEANEGQAPLHVYLRKKGRNFREVLEELCPDYCPFIFFEGAQENYHKLMELVRKFLKKRKGLVLSLQEIDEHIRSLGIDRINMNKFANYRALLELGLLEMGKEVYFWPHLSASLVVDRAYFAQQHSKKEAQQWESTHLTEEALAPYKDFLREKVLVVDDARRLEYCGLVLRSCRKYGADLEGKLSLSGSVDLVQISCLNQRKFIFVLDFWKA